MGPIGSNASSFCRSFVIALKSQLITGLDWTGLDWTGLDWTGLDWTGLDWTGLDWTGLDWTGLDWTGLDWTEIQESAFLFKRLSVALQQYNAACIRDTYGATQDNNSDFASLVVAYQPPLA